MEKHYRFGNANFSLVTDFDFETGEQMAPFVTEKSENEVVCSFCKAKELSAPRGKKIFSSASVNIFGEGTSQVKAYTLPLMKDYSALITKSGQGYSCIYDEKHSEYFLKDINLVNAIGIEQIAYAFDTFILHCSFVEYNQKAVLFTGVSGIGKSTRANMWVQELDAEIINGDRAGLYFDNGVLYACGLPVAGSSEIYVNKCLPVDSIVIIGQALENRTRRADLSQAVKSLYYNIIVNSWNKKYCENAVAFVMNMVGSANVFVSECNLELDSLEEQLLAMGYLK